MYLKKMYMESRSCLFIVVSISISLLILFGCASIAEEMESWKGQHKSDLILAWGPATRTASDGKDGLILIYEYFTENEFNEGVADNSFKTTTIETEYYQFYTNVEGIIYHVRWGVNHGSRK